MSDHPTRDMSDERPVEIRGIDYVEMYVANNYQAAHFFRTVLGFTVAQPNIRYRNGDRESVVVKNGSIKLVLTSALSEDSDVTRFISRHGEGISDVALVVNDLTALCKRAVNQKVAVVEDSITDLPNGAARRCARVRSCGNVTHTLFEAEPVNTRGDNHSCFAETSENDGGVKEIDHIALAVGAGEREMWKRFYVDIFGCVETHEEDVNTEYSGMRSTVVEATGGAVRFPIVEPTLNRKRSQVDNYIVHNVGGGVQHLALSCGNIVTVAEGVAKWLDLVPTPAAYYASLANRVGTLPFEMALLERLGILVDRDDTGLLFQVFTRPIGARPTLFLEFIQRLGSKGFGSGNIRSLFEALERAQENTTDRDRYVVS